MVKPYYIYGCSVYYMYEQILLHLWLSLSNFKFDTWNCGTTHNEHSTDHKELEPRLRRLIENYKSISQRMRMTSLWPLGLEVTGITFHLWLSLITFMVVPFITFMGKFYYIYG